MKKFIIWVALITLVIVIMAVFVKAGSEALNYLGLSAGTTSDANATQETFREPVTSDWGGLIFLGVISFLVARMFLRYASGYLKTAVLLSMALSAIMVVYGSYNLYASYGSREIVALVKSSLDGQSPNTYPEIYRATDGLPIIDQSRQIQPLQIPANGEMSFYVLGTISISYGTCQKGEVWGGQVDDSLAAAYGIVKLLGPAEKPALFKVESTKDSTCKS